MSPSDASNDEASRQRADAARHLARVLDQRGSLATLDSNTAPLVRELTHGTARFYPRLNSLLKGYLQRPLKPADQDVRALLLIGLYQLLETDIPRHAAVDATVSAARQLSKPWARGLINGVLRTHLRRGVSAEVLALPEYTSAHPAWLADSIRRSWPGQADAIMQSNNSRAPMTLCVYGNDSRDGYLRELADQGIEAVPGRLANSAVILKKPRPVAQLPGFADGRVSVQDEGAQLTTRLLAPAEDDRVLDACAAPGGKALHLLMQSGNRHLTMLEVSADRCRLIEQNLTRMQIRQDRIQLHCADATAPDSWWDGQPFQHILLDAPCSASGVIRRNPDSKITHREEDIHPFAQRQLRLLSALWPTLADGGRLLYVTCSIFKEENDQVVERFIANSDARCLPLEASWGHATEFGRQILPSMDGPDGFYFCLLQKQDNSVE